jgi:hypothetical protein
VRLRGTFVHERHVLILVQATSPSFNADYVFFPKMLDRILPANRPPQLDWAVDLLLKISIRLALPFSKHLSFGGGPNRTTGCRPSPPSPQPSGTMLRSHYPSFTIYVVHPLSCLGCDSLSVFKCRYTAVWDYPMIASIHAPFGSPRDSPHGMYAAKLKIEDNWLILRVPKGGARLLDHNMQLFTVKISLYLHRMISRSS